MTKEAIDRNPQFVAYLAVLPFYRQACIAALKAEAGDRVQLFAGPHHLDSTVTTGIDPALYTPVKNTAILSKMLLQSGHWRDVIAAETAILDLNPRSISVWIHTITRRILRRRTLLWGHLFPRAGQNSKTAFLRRLLRRLSHGTVLYGYGSVVPAREELPGSPLWVAPNSVSPASAIVPAGSDEERTSFVYVGRLEPSKKVELLLRGFAAMQDPSVTLNIVGEGSQRKYLEQLALELRADVRFWGKITDLEELRSVYSSAIASASPGYVGLGLTQTLGFGVPMVVSRDEPHAPEIELSILKNSLTFFDTDSVKALSEVLTACPRVIPWADRVALCDQLRIAYSAEAMSRGLMDAFENRTQKLGASGWPM